jgi:putative serine protease PepD
MTEDAPPSQQSGDPGAHLDPSGAASGQSESPSPLGHQPWGNQPRDGPPTAGTWSTLESAASPPTIPIGLPSSSAAAPRPRRSRIVAGALGLSLIVGLAAGGVGGVVGYHFASTGTGAISALDQPVPGASSAAAIPHGSVEQVAQRVIPSVVQLRVNGSQVTDEGSGVVLSADGLILTNNHVVEPAANGGDVTAVLQDGRSVPVQIVGRAPSFDLAVVRAQGVGGLSLVQLGSSSALRVGQQVVAIGSPLGLSGTVTSGIISALQRPVRAGGEASGQDTVLDAIQTDAAINPGNSGGPLTDMAGRVIGINSAIASLGFGDGQSGSIGLGFAIPIDQARRIADELIHTGHATQALLGVTVPASQPDDTAAVVQQVTPGTAAATAGIQAGNKIAKVDDRLIDSGDALIAAIRSHTPGSSVTLTVTNSAGATRQVHVTLGSQQVATP